ncbi:MAG: hypothetical protein HFE63_00310 [Clostridiales bacterium]|nr:hypothetical protein [Clostridiales bacterium]
MRNFRSTRTNLNDVRIAYTYLIALALALSIMGLIASGLDNKLSASELAEYRTSLSECADSLRGYIETEAPERRFVSALRFENAVVSLNCTDNVRAELLNLADRLQKSVFEREIDMLATVTELRGLADTFSMLTMLEYDDRASAVMQISDEIARVVGIEDETSSDSLSNDEPYSGGKVEQFNLSAAKNNAERLLGDAVRSLTFEGCTDGYFASADNLSMLFSPNDGSPISIVYLRLGGIPNAYFTEREIIDYAERITADAVFGGDSGELDVAGIKSMCGYTMVELGSETDMIRAIIDEHGRICVFERTGK